jgi:nucleoside-diphosphate-sugar epimerase
VKIFLTGATGFIGGNFLRQALENGHEVAVLLNPDRDLPHEWNGLNGLRVFRGTLEISPFDEISKFSPQICVHSAWIATPGIYLESPENVKLVESSRNFIAALTGMGVRHVVGLGTCIEYRMNDTLLVEDLSPIEPTTLYAQCKNELHSALRVDASKKGFALCWARVFYPYGPGEHPQRLCTSLIKKFRAGEKLVLKTPNSTKDYIHIHDLGSALLKVCESKFHGVLNLGTGEGITVRTIADTIAKKLGRPDLVDEASPPQPDPMGYVVADASRLKELGWKAKFDVESGIDSLLKSL